MAPFYTDMAQRKAYYRGGVENAIDALVVVETGDEGVRVSENRDTRWCKPYWMPEYEFEDVTEKAERVGLLPDDTFEDVVGVAKSDILA
jgi:hypothetical protein